ncbi:MAG: hypothetical protein ACI86C_001337 [Candidatus Latescibacterota bacterium]
MNTTNYTSLLAHPQNISKEGLSDLTNVIAKYPYFQSAHALQLKGLHKDSSFLYNDALKLTAAYTADRDILFEYITSKTFIQNEISQVIIEHDASTADLEVISENISEEISFEIDQQLKEELKKANAILSPELFQRKQASIEDIIENSSDTNDTTFEENLDIEAPLAFTEKDTYSFSAWLKLTQAKPIARTDSEIQKKTSEENSSKNSNQEAKNRKFNLIERFIQDRPKILPKKKSDKQENVAPPHTHGSATLMTETLARVYAQQKNYLKAIQAYKILILKNPEKSGFFADQIRAVQQLIDTEQQ